MCERERKEVGKRKGGVTCTDKLPDRGKKRWRVIDLRWCVGGLSGS